MKRTFDQEDELNQHLIETTDAESPRNKRRSPSVGIEQQFQGARAFSQYAGQELIDNPWPIQFGAGDVATNQAPAASQQHVAQQAYDSLAMQKIPVRTEAVPASVQGTDDLSAGEQEFPTSNPLIIKGIIYQLGTWNTKQKLDVCFPLDTRRKQKSQSPNFFMECCIKAVAKAVEEGQASWPKRQELVQNLVLILCRDLKATFSIDKSKKGTSSNTKPLSQNEATALILKQLQSRVERKLRALRFEAERDEYEEQLSTDERKKLHQLNQLMPNQIEEAIKLITVPAFGPVQDEFSNSSFSESQATKDAPIQEVARPAETDAPAPAPVALERQDSANCDPIDMNDFTSGVSDEFSSFFFESNHHNKSNE